MFFDIFFKKKLHNEINKSMDKNVSLYERRNPIDHIDYNRLYTRFGRELTDSEIKRVYLKNGQRYMDEPSGTTSVTPYRVYTKDEFMTYQEEKKINDKRLEQKEKELFKKHLAYLGLLK